MQLQGVLLNDLFLPFHFLAGLFLVETSDTTWEGTHSRDGNCNFRNFGQAGVIVRGRENQTETYRRNLRGRFFDGKRAHSFLYDNETAQFQFSPNNFSCGTRQEQSYRQASAAIELNVAPHLLQLQNSGLTRVCQPF